MTTGPTSEEDLMARSRRGDMAALETLLVRELPRLRAFARLNMDEVLRARESQSDLVQSVCREVLGELGQFEFRSVPAFRGWLCEWTLRKIRDRRKYWLADRRNAGRERVPADTSMSGPACDPCYASVFSPSQEAVARETAERLEAAFEQMPDAWRMTLALSRIAGLSHAEIAERTGRSEGNVRVTLHRALARLATVLAQMDGSRPAG